MFKERNRAVPAVYLILRRGDEVLLMRRQGSGYYDGSYSLPTGHVEVGELPRSAIAREAHEELGIEINPNDMVFTHCMYRTKRDETGDRVDFFYECSWWKEEIVNQEPQKCDDIRWFSRSALPVNMMHHVRTALDFVAEGVKFSELSIDYFNSIQQSP